MIIEITDPSGSGKSSFIKDLLEILIKRGEKTGAINSIYLNKSKYIPDFFSDIDSHNLNTDIRALPWTLVFLIQFPFFFCFYSILIMDEKFFNKISIFRSFYKKSRHFSFLMPKQIYRHHYISRRRLGSQFS